MYSPSMIACACIVAALRSEAERVVTWDSSTALSFTDHILTQLHAMTQIENVSFADESCKCVLLILAKTFVIVSTSLRHAKKKKKKNNRKFCAAVLNKLKNLWDR